MHLFWASSVFFLGFSGFFHLLSSVFPLLSFMLCSHCMSSKWICNLWVICVQQWCPAATEVPLLISKWMQHESLWAFWLMIVVFFVQIQPCLQELKRLIWKREKMERLTSICPNVSQTGWLEGRCDRGWGSEEAENELFHLRVRVEKARPDSTHMFTLEEWKMVGAWWGERFLQSSVWRQCVDCVLAHSSLQTIAHPVLYNKSSFPLSF